MTFWRPTWLKWSALVPLALLVLAIGVRTYEPPIVTQMRLKVFDTFQQIEPRHYENVGVRVLDIDETSLSKIGQWPWPRDRLAEIVARLTELGAAAIAFDAVFSEPDRLSPGRLSQLLPPGKEFDALRDGLANVPDNDDLFARVIEQAPVVLGFALSHGGSERQPLAKWGVASVGDEPVPYLTPFGSAVTSLPALERAAAGNGSINVVPESDGIIRRLPLFLNLNGVPLPSLDAEALRVALGASTYVLKAAGAQSDATYGESGMVSVRIGPLVIPTDNTGQVWVRYTTEVPERFVPVWKLLAGEVPEEKIANHIVLIGATAIALKDLRATPFSPTAPGVEVHAQLLETVLAGNFLLRPGWAQGLEIVGSAVLGLLLIVLLPRWGALWCALLAVGAVALILAAVWIAFVYYNLLFDPLYAALVVVLIYLSQSLLMFLSTEAERERIRGAFGMYLSPALVEQLASHPEQLKLGGELRTLSILFCDVRGFTSISELYDPQALTRLINRFLTPMSQIILDGRGTIDKYMGDCIMAFWNAPLDVPDHAGAACRASLEMYRRLNILNDELKEESKKLGREFRPLHVGVGLNTGLVCVGNMGSEQRFDYSVLGDDVNLASRLEGQSKTYGVDVVISEATRSAAEGFATIEIDLIRVKGKSQPVRIHALLGDAGMRAEPWFAPLEALQLEVLAAYRAQDWSRAATLSAQARAAAGGRLDALYDLYDERIAECAANPPGPEWDGVYEATSK